MGKTRNLLEQINRIIDIHQVESGFLIRKYCANPHLEMFYRNQIASFDQKCEKKLREMINEHIEYLEEKDPYGREPLWGAEAKKQLFLNLRQTLSPQNYQGGAYIKKLAQLSTQLLQNDIIDKPRWPGLQLDNVFHFFKSMFAIKNTYLDSLKSKREHLFGTHKPKNPKH